MYLQQNLSLLLITIAGFKLTYFHYDGNITETIMIILTSALFLLLFKVHRQVALAQ